MKRRGFDGIHMITPIKQRKPVSILCFDGIYWLAYLISVIDEARHFSVWSEEAARLWLIGAGPMTLIAFAIWAFASLHRSLVALVLIAANAVLGVIVFGHLHMTPDIFWLDPTKVFFKIAPSLLLGLALGLLMAPSAKSWHRRDMELQVKVFE